MIVASLVSKFTTITESEGLHCVYKSRRSVPVLKPKNSRQILIVQFIKTIFYTVLPSKIFTFCLSCRVYSQSVCILHMSIRAIHPSGIIVLNPTIIPMYWETHVFVCSQFLNGCYWNSCFGMHKIHVHGNALCGYNAGAYCMVKHGDTLVTTSI